MGQKRNYKRIQNYFGFKNNENTCHFKFGDIVNSVLGGNVIDLEIYIIKIERLQISKLRVHLKKLEWLGFPVSSFTGWGWGAEF